MTIQNAVYADKHTHTFIYISIIAVAKLFLLAFFRIVNMCVSLLSLAMLLKAAKTLIGKCKIMFCLQMQCFVFSLICYSPRFFLHSFPLSLSVSLTFAQIFSYPFAYRVCVWFFFRLLWGRFHEIQSQLFFFRFENTHTLELSMNRESAKMLKWFCHCFQYQMYICVVINSNS